MGKKQKKGEKLSLWKGRLKESDGEFGAEVAKMDEREKIYNGDRSLTPMVEGDRSQGKHRTCHVRNIVFENIESQVSASIPQPKVTPRRKRDEHLAEIVEHFLRNELNRLPFEVMNDMAERTVPIQGGVGFLTDWDNTKRTWNTVGEVTVNMVHPKQFAPQPGVYTGIRDMDWFIVKLPTTKAAVRRKYGVDVSDEGEAEPDIRSADGTDTAKDAVTMYVGFARNDNGGIDRYTWVNDTELEDLENYQARRQPVCARCGRVRPLPGQIISADLQDAIGGDLLPDPERGFRGGLIPKDILERAKAGRVLAGIIADTESTGEGILEGVEVKAAAPKEPEKYDGGPCPWCGCDKWDSREQEYEEIMVPIKTAMGVEIPGAQPGFDEEGRAAFQPTLVPFYRPDVYPIILQRSVSVYGKLLGNSDVDVIRDQQNTVNRLEQKIINRLLKAGTRVTLPARADLRMDSEDGERWYINNPSEKQLIDVYEFKGDLQYELMYLSTVYEEARQILGITDSFQGRKDTTATSGKAKEFSAAQAAGRLESKRVMKNAAYAELFELMFKFWLAYSDEPRPVSYKDSKGETVYEQFNRYDFLEQSEDGTWHWNDQFLFSCDSSAPLASNREAMWQETRQNLQSGAFGDPRDTETLILFWSKMEELHYPGAGATKKYLEERLERQRQQEQMMQTQALMEQSRQQTVGQMGAGM